MEDSKEETLDFPVSDVIKFYLEDGSFIAVRPSGTEPKCKFYYCVRGNGEVDALEKTKMYQTAMRELTK